MTVDHEDILVLALVVDDCSRYHVTFADKLARVTNRATLKAAIREMQAEIVQAKEKRKGKA